MGVLEGIGYIKREGKMCILTREVDESDSVESSQDPIKAEQPQNSQHSCEMTNYDAIED